MLRQLRYLLRHKWFVFRAGWRLGVPLWQLLIHDWTKFLPSEWPGYVQYFRDRQSEFRQGRLDGGREDWIIDYAWNHHQKSCPHHWQYWVLIEDGPTYRPLPMPDRDVREMVADWEGAGRAKGGIDAKAWFLRDGYKMLLHAKTRQRVEQLLGITSDLAPVQVS